MSTTEQSIVLRHVEAPELVGIVWPGTGEIVDLVSAPLDDIAGVRAAVAALLADASEALKAIDAVIEDRARSAGTWTLHTESAGALKLTLRPAYVNDASAMLLREKLQAFVDDGVIAPDAVDNCIPLILRPKAKVGTLKKLADMRGGAVAEAIAEAMPAESRRVEVC